MENISNLVSIIIPCYNNEKYVAYAIESALKQTWQNIEVIVVDDGSTDRSINVINSFKNDVKIVQQVNSGASAARNNGFKHAKGSYINYFDSDDLMCRHKIEKSLSAFDNNTDIIICDKIIFSEKNENINKKWKYDIRYRKEIQKNRKKWNGKNLILSTLTYSITTNASLIKRSVIESNGGFDERLSNQDDMEFYYRMAINGVRIKKIEDVMVFVRDHESPTRLRKSKKQPINALKAQDIMFENTIKMGINDKLIMQVHANRYARFGRKLYQLGEHAKADYAISKAYTITRYPKSTSSNIYNVISDILGIKRMEKTIYYVNKLLKF